MVLIVSIQSNVSYAHVQEVMRLLPDAIAETGGGKPNYLLAAHGLTSAITGAAPYRFFCVTQVDECLVGFLAGLLESDAFTDRRTAREVFAYVRPSARVTDARAAMRAAFEAWAWEQRASRVQCVGDEVAIPGYVRAGTLWTKEADNG